MNLSNIREGELKEFFDLQPNLVYSEDHLDLFGNDIDNLSLQEISAAIIGREIKK